MSNSHLFSAFAAVICAALLAACGGPGRPDDRRAPAPTGDPALQHGAMIVKSTGLLLADMDINRDLATDTRELDQATAALFAAIDKDNRGIISAVEFADWAMINLGTRYPVPGLARFDADASLSIGKTEFADGLKSLFATYDKDGNGTVTRSELFTQLNIPSRGGGGASGLAGGGRPDRGGGGRRAG